MMMKPGGTTPRLCVIVLSASGVACVVYVTHFPEMLSADVPSPKVKFPLIAFSISRRDLNRDLRSVATHWRFFSTVVGTAPMLSKVGILTRSPSTREFQRPE